MSILDIFRKSEEQDWRDLDALPNEVISKEELDSLQKEAIQELERLQDETIQKTPDADQTAKPQTLFYCRKYINAKFNKNNLSIDNYYAKKQNVIDGLYAEGLGELEAEFTDYKDLIEQIREVEHRMRRKAKILDPKTHFSSDEARIYDDSAKLAKEISELPCEINWDSFKGEK